MDERTAVGTASSALGAVQYLRPTPFEIATSWVHGMLPPTPLPTSARSPLQVLEDAIRPALAAGPCFVTFSGGRDSSAVLAVATHLARREGFPEPVPVTRIYPGVAESDESEWQELVVRHLGLTEWIRLERRGEDELLGEAARASVQRRGILWPPALHVQGTVYAALGQGGSVLTGEGGDEVLGPRRITPITLLLRKRRRPTRHLVASNVRAVLPASGRAAVRHVELRNGAAWYPWLRPAAARRHHQMMAADEAAEPLFYDAATRWIARRRAWSVMDWNHRLIAAEYGLSALNPLLDPAFLAALARFGGRWGFAGRTATMKALFADVLPLAILSRSTKARFNEIYSGDEIRSFARQWDGSGVDPDMVDPERLREAWLSEEPTFASAPLLHQAWLTTQRTPRSVTR